MLDLLRHKYELPMVTKVRKRVAHCDQFYEFIPGTDGPAASHGSVKSTYAYEDSFTGDTNPRWREEVASVQNATTSASGVIHDSENWPRCFVQTQNHPVKGQYLLQGFCDAGPMRANTAGFSFAKADSEARVNFLNEIRQARRAFQSGVFLGELAETLHMIRNPAAAFRRGLDNYHGAVKKRLRRERSDASKRKAVAGTWLEYTFGWQPLVNDVRDGMKALAKHSSKIEGTAISSFGRDTVAPVKQTNSTSCPGGFTFNIGYLRRGEVSVRYKGFVGTEIRNATDVRENWGLTLSDVVPTVWELIPYSFLVDYFTNVGDVLSAMSSSTAGLRWVNRTMRSTSTVTIYRKPTIGSNLSWAKVSGFVLGDYRSNCTQFSRDRPDLSVSLSDFHFQIPGFESRKWLNIAALGALRT